MWAKAASFSGGWRNPHPHDSNADHMNVAAHPLRIIDFTHSAIVCCCVAVEYGFSSVADVCSDDCAAW